MNGEGYQAVRSGVVVTYSTFTWGCEITEVIKPRATAKSESFTLALFTEVTYHTSVVNLFNTTYQQICCSSDKNNSSVLNGSPQVVCDFYTVSNCWRWLYMLYGYAGPLLQNTVVKHALF